MPSNARTSLRPAYPEVTGTAPGPDPAPAPVPPPTPDDPFMSVTGAAEYLNVSRGFIQDAIYTKGTLPAFKIGRNVLRVRRSDVVALVTRFYR